MGFIWKYFTGFLSVTVVVFLWWYLTKDLPDSKQFLYPSPGNVISAFERNSWRILEFSLTTWWRILLGLAIGGGIGFLIGLLMHSSLIFRRTIDPIIEVIRPIPPIALTPFFIIWFGLGDAGQVAIISLTSFMIISVGTFVAMNNVSSKYIKAALTLGADSAILYKTILIPAILPSMVSSMRVASASAFGVTVAAEYLGAQGGLGFMIRNARTVLDTDAILLAAVMLGVLSLGTDWIIRVVFKQVTPWSPEWRLEK